MVRLLLVLLLIAPTNLVADYVEFKLLEGEPSWREGWYCRSYFPETETIVPSDGVITLKQRMTTNAGESISAIFVYEVTPKRVICRIFVIPSTKDD